MDEKERGQQKVEGYLEKQGEVYKTWKKRWFALEGDKLLYYQTSADAPTKPIDFISLAPGTQVSFFILFRFNVSMFSSVGD